MELSRKKTDLTAMSRHLLKLAKALRHSAPEKAVHQFRVYARRILLYLRLHPELAAYPKWKKEMKKLRSLRRRLGSVREIDVHRHLWEELAGKLSGASDWPTHMKRLREKELEKIFSKADPLRCAEAILKKAKQARASAPPPPAKIKLRKRFEKLLRAQQDFEKKRRLADLHRVRIEIKKLRYSLEPWQASRGEEMQALLDRLKKAQARLGRIHDLETLSAAVKRHFRRGLAAAARRVLTQAKADIRRGVSEWRRAWPGHSRSLKSFLARMEKKT